MKFQIPGFSIVIKSRLLDKNDIYSIMIDALTVQILCFLQCTGANVREQGTLFLRTYPLKIYHNTLILITTICLDDF